MYKALGLLATAILATSGAGCSGKITGNGGLSGTYELTATSRGGSDTSSGRIILDSSNFTFQLNEWQLAFHASGNTLTTTYTSRSKFTDITTSHVPTYLDMGQNPLGLGGAWTFRGKNNETCQANIDDGTFSGSCAHYFDGTVTAQRTSKLSSIFGELGGEWKLTAKEGGGAVTKFDGNTFSSSLTNRNGDVTESVTVTIVNGVASGHTDDGIEFSARRL